MGEIMKWSVKKQDTINKNNKKHIKHHTILKIENKWLDINISVNKIEIFQFKVYKLITIYMMLLLKIRQFLQS